MTLETSSLTAFSGTDDNSSSITSMGVESDLNNHYEDHLVVDFKLREESVERERSEIHRGTGRRLKPWRWSTSTWLHKQHIPKLRTPRIITSKSFHHLQHHQHPPLHHYHLHPEVGSEPSAAISGLSCSDKITTNSSSSSINLASTISASSANDMNGTPPNLTNCRNTPQKQISPVLPPPQPEANEFFYRKVETVFIKRQPVQVTLRSPSEENTPYIDGRRTGMAAESKL